MGERGGGRRNFCLAELNPLQALVYTRFDVHDAAKVIVGQIHVSKPLLNG
jgi:hypothetical protein